MRKSHTRTRWSDGCSNPLRSAGQLDRTLIVVTADHGESLGEHGETTHGLFAYESTIHVPMIVRVPGYDRRSTGRRRPRGCGADDPGPRRRRDTAESRRTVARRSDSTRSTVVLRGARCVPDARLGPAQGHGPERLEIHRPARSRAVRPGVGCRRSTQRHRPWRSHRMAAEVRWLLSNSGATPARRPCRSTRMPQSAFGLSGTLAERRHGHRHRPWRTIPSDWSRSTSSSIPR